ncbi:MAG: LuxR C-terminal-related transcriptional regulator [Bacillota bacterium]
MSGERGAAAGSRAGNLPAPISTFIGRQQEMATVQQMLNAHRLVTLVGSGGMGKTRLAIEACRPLVGQWADGIWLVELAAVTDPARITQVATGALGLPETAPGEGFAALLHHLRHRRALLLLDNCEHLLEACAGFALDLLQGCPHLRILATSRAALGVPGEALCRVETLPLPKRADLPTLSPEEILSFDAVQLLVERIRAIRPSFRLDPESARTLAEICIRLDGVPLALELAAARTKLLSPEQIALRLDDRLHLLTDGSRTALPRQQTLKALLDWSFDLLPPTEQALFRRLAVFQGDWSLEAVEAVAGDGEGGSLIDLLGRLVDHSLVNTREVDGSIRYSMLETIREYALVKLEESGEQAPVRKRHLDWLLRLVEGPAAAMTSAERWRVLGRELENIRAAMAWALGPGEDPGAAARLFTAVLEFWHAGVLEGERWLKAILAKSYRLPPELLVRLLLDGARMSLWQRDMPGLEGLAQRALEISRQTGNTEGAVEARGKLAIAALMKGEYPRGEALAQAVLQEAREIGDTELEGQLLNQLGRTKLVGGQWEEAEAILRQAAAVNQAGGFLMILDGVLHNLGWLRLRQRRLAEAEALQRERRQLLEGMQLGLNPRFVEQEARISYLRGEYRQAVALCQEALALMTSGQSSQNQQSVEVLMALAYLRLGHLPEAVALLEGAVGRVARQGWPRGYLPAAECALLAEARREWLRAAFLTGASPEVADLYWGAEGELEAAQPALRAALGEERYTAALRAGRSAPLERVVAVCLGQAEVALPDAPKPPPEPALPDGLTSREVEVISLAAQGLSDREIAARLFISPRTVETHLRNIYNKVGVSKRAALVAYALRHGLA